LGQEPQAIECDDLAWVDIEDLGDYPMGKVDRRIAGRLAQAGHDG
jgi:hypothetical protein